MFKSNRHEKVASGIDTSMISVEALHKNESEIQLQTTDVHLLEDGKGRNPALKIDDQIIHERDSEFKSADQKEKSKAGSPWNRVPSAKKTLVKMGDSASVAKIAFDLNEFRQRQNSGKSFSEMAS